MPIVEREMHELGNQPRHKVMISNALNRNLGQDAEGYTTRQSCLSTAILHFISLDCKTAN